jgi:pimeloyl-ACP methyl ester carboxylesterase
MTPAIFLPGFDGDAALRSEFVEALARRRPATGVSYPAQPLGSLARYREHAMAQAPVDWTPVLIAESFSGLVATCWASMDPRVRAVVLCGAFARNPVGAAARFGAAWPTLVKLTPWLSHPVALASGDPRRARWSQALLETMGALPAPVVAERLTLIAHEDLGGELERLRVPVVIVQFDDDQVVGPRARKALEAACPAARVLRLPGPHFALETRPADCALAIDVALREILSEPTPDP